LMCIKSARGYFAAALLSFYLVNNHQSRRL